MAVDSRLASAATVLSFFLLAAPCNAQAERVEHYDQLRALLFAGATVTAVFSPGRCDANNAEIGKGAAPVVSGGFAVHDFLEVPGDNIGFSNQHLTLRPDGTPVLELVQYRVKADDSATIRVSFLSPVTFQSPSAPKIFQCRIGAGLWLTVRD
jgi:hypothetical protein